MVHADRLIYSEVTEIGIYKDEYSPLSAREKPKVLIFLGVLRVPKLM
jgi:hypothetical protein